MAKSFWQTRWTDERMEILRRMWATHSYQEIAEATGSTPEAVRRRGERTPDLPQRGSKRARFWTHERIARLRELLPTHTHQQIADALGVTRGAVSQQAQQMGLKRFDMPLEDPLVSGGEPEAPEQRDHPLRVAPGHLASDEFSRRAIMAALGR